MPTDLIIVIAALVVSWLVFTALIKVVKTTFTTAVAIAAIVLGLQLAFGVSPQELWQQLTELPQILRRLFTGN